MSIPSVNSNTSKKKDKYSVEEIYFTFYFDCQASADNHISEFQEVFEGRLELCNGQNIQDEYEQKRLSFLFPPRTDQDETIKEYFASRGLDLPPYYAKLKLRNFKIDSYDIYRIKSKVLFGTKNGYFFHPMGLKSWDVFQTEMAKLLDDLGCFNLKIMDRESAFKYFKQSIIDEIVANLNKRGVVILDNFLEMYKGVVMSNEDVLRILINERGISGIFSSDLKVFTTAKFLREQLVRVTPQFWQRARDPSGFTFREIAMALPFPLLYVGDIFERAIKENVILGTIDKEKGRLHIRGIPFPHKFKCQMCNETNEDFKFLKCTKCDLELCWGHFEELVSKGQTSCPRCHESLILLPKYCEKGRHDVSYIPKRENLCDRCKSPLKIKDNLRNFQQLFIDMTNLK